MGLVISNMEPNVAPAADIIFVSLIITPEFCTAPAVPLNFGTALSVEVTLETKALLNVS
jgi:hypothetical protein